MGRVRAAVRIAWAAKGTALHVAAILGGWVFVTAGAADVVRWWGLDPWPLSLGLFLLSLAGWSHLRVLFAAGVYALSRKPGA